MKSTGAEATAFAVEYLDPIPEISVNSQRRYVARIPIELPLRLASMRFSAAATTLDVSVSGLQVRTQLPLTMGERVILKLKTTAEEPEVNVCAEVIRITEGDPEQLNALLSEQEGVSARFKALARLTAATSINDAPCYGLRILKDDGPIWQNYVRSQVLS